MQGQLRGRHAPEVPVRDLDERVAVGDARCDGRVLAHAVQHPEERCRGGHVGVCPDVRLRAQQESLGLVVVDAGAREGYGDEAGLLQLDAAAEVDHGVHEVCDDEATIRERHQSRLQEGRQGACFARRHPPVYMRQKMSARSSPFSMYSLITAGTPLAAISSSKKRRKSA